MSSEDSKYAIHAAAREGRDPKLSKVRDDDGRLPVHWAASANHPAIVLMLAQQEGFDPDAEDDSGWTPLMIAASVKDGDKTVELLLSRGADVNQKTLHFVASKNNLEVARKLLDSKPPASTRVRDKRGQYPLHRAAAVGSVPMVTLLLKNGSPLNATDITGYTALHHAVAEGHGWLTRRHVGDTAVALLKAGAEADKRDSDGYLALDLAPDKEVLKYIKREAENEGIDL
ncbi:ankyrin repeat-containing domain protein [Durotheca rogersii]|uniref:ankyrin repeat-containing domain protein n=1 Tax=Durotheca rogersii TaxID=419775 RepID=UPI00221EFFFE|nr:ankyrin repeat-containing domain protein [Durotheca rogersii]KAI5864980.1 ankyrin repeat-containing domain protein [Durotheca rogersii]